MNYYTLEDKPNFRYGEMVAVDMSQVGESGLGILPGRIVGRGMIQISNYSGQLRSNRQEWASIDGRIIDSWLVEFNQDFSPTYPYRVMSVPHYAMLA